MATRFRLPLALLALLGLLTGHLLAEVDDDADTTAWHLVPGADEAIDRLLAAARSDASTTELWHNLVGTDGDRLLPLLTALGRSDRYRQVAFDGLHLWLREMSLPAAHQAILGLADDDRQRLLALVDRMPLREAEMVAHLHLVKLLNAIGEHQLAFKRGRIAWLAWPNDALLANVAAAVDDGRLGQRLWEQAGADVYAHDNVAYRIAEIAFYADLARLRRTPGPVRSLIGLARLEEADPTALAPLVSHLARLGMRNDIRHLLRATDDPVLRYLYLSEGEGRPPTDGEWQTIFHQADTAAARYRLAMLLRDAHPRRAQDAWNLIVASEDALPHHLAGAHLHLALTAERELRFSDAADNYELMIDHLDDTAEAPADEQRQRLLRHVARLREQAAASPDDVQVQLNLARVSLENRDYARALQAAEKATLAAPDNPIAWNLLFEICKQSNRFDRLGTIGDRLAQLEVPADDPSELTNTALNLADAGHLDRALALARTAVKGANGAPAPRLVLAIVLDRLGRYPEAIEMLNRLLAEEFTEGRVYRALGMAYAQHGDLRSAIGAFDKVAERGKGDDYVSLWTALLRRRLVEDGSADLRRYREARGDQLPAWPRQLYGFVLGDSDEAALLAAAEASADANVRQGQLAEAWFCIGQTSLAAGDRERATVAFRQVVERHLTVYVEHAWAAAELRQLAAEEAAPKGQPARP